LAEGLNKCVLAHYLVEPLLNHVRLLNILEFTFDAGSRSRVSAGPKKLQILSFRAFNAIHYKKGATTSNNSFIAELL
jgi:hypothetical protein